MLPGYIFENEEVTVLIYAEVLRQMNAETLKHRAAYFAFEIDSGKNVAETFVHS